MAMLHIGVMEEIRTTAAQLIERLQQLPPGAEVVTSITGWEGPQLGPVTIIEAVRVEDEGRHVIPTVPPAGRTVYMLDTPG